MFFSAKKNISIFYRPKRTQTEVKVSVFLKDPYTGAVKKKKKRTLSFVSVTVHFYFIFVAK